MTFALPFSLSVPLCLHMRFTVIVISMSSCDCARRLTLRGTCHLKSLYYCSAVSEEQDQIASLRSKHELQEADTHAQMQLEYLQRELCANVWEQNALSVGSPWRVWSRVNFVVESVEELTGGLL